MKNKKAVAVAGLFSVALVSGSFAYFNQTMEVKNPFTTGAYSSELVETFNPGDGANWEPGTTVDKKIQVANTGDYDVIARVKFDESWARSEKKFVDTKGLDEKASQKNATDGLTKGDHSVVKKNLANNKNWFYNSTDGYWYYLKNVASGQNTGDFLKSVTLLEDADMGNYKVVNYYTTAQTQPGKDAVGDDAATQWKVYTGQVPEDAKYTRSVAAINDKSAGYADADYELTITVQTVQATKDALQSAFGLTKVDGSSWNLD